MSSKTKRGGQRRRTRARVDGILRPLGKRITATEEPSPCRDFPVGFTRMQVPPNIPMEIAVKPQVLYKGKRLVVAPSIAKAFVIEDLTVGKDSQLATTEELGAEVFSPTAVGSPMDLDPAAPGVVIKLRVRNITPKPEDFFAVLYGAVLAP